MRAFLFYCFRDFNLDLAQTEMEMRRVGDLLGIAFYYSASQKLKIFMRQRANMRLESGNDFNLN